MIYLYGAPASGKTTLGRRLAAALGARFVDLDEAVEARSGMRVADMFAKSGERFFRDAESAELSLVASDAAAAGGETVVSLGGGTLLDPHNRELCEKSGLVICLESPSDEELARRIGAAAGSRPLGNKARERAPHYASFSCRVAAWFDLGDSLVLCGKGFASKLVAGRPAVADATVAELWRGKVDANVAVVPSGEEHKTVATVSSLWSAFAKAGLGRRDTVVAVGGGVTCDLTGFAAATWMRGIDWINVPTTLLAMVDASTGGKTGCDLPEGKNLAGAFHLPRLVAIDTEFLSTLPAEILRQGRAEMIKHEIIGGLPPKGGESSAGGVPSPAEIARNLSVKVGIVKEDPFERKGRRILLNCGHTVAHAVEKLSGYTLPHGEAVAIGCVEEARMAVRRGLAPADWPGELAARFAEAGLPVALPEGLDLAAAAEAMKGDKKRAGGTVVFALPCGWGDVRAVPVDLGKENPFE